MYILSSLYTFLSSLLSLLHHFLIPSLSSHPHSFDNVSSLLTFIFSFFFHFSLAILPVVCLFYFTSSVFLFSILPFSPDQTFLASSLFHSCRLFPTILHCLLSSYVFTLQYFHYNLSFTPEINTFNARLFHFFSWYSLGSHFSASSIHHPAACLDDGVFRHTAPSSSRLYPL